MDKVWCGYCKYYFDGKCMKNNVEVHEDNLSDCQIYEPVVDGIMAQIEAEKHWLEIERGKGQ